MLRFWLSSSWFPYDCFLHLQSSHLDREVWMWLKKRQLATIHYLSDQGWRSVSTRTYGCLPFILTLGDVTARITLFFIFAWRLHPKSREGKGNVGQPFILGRTFTLDRSTAWRPRMQSQESAVWTLLPMESSPILDREEVLIGEESMDMKLLDSKFQEWKVSGKDGILLGITLNPKKCIGEKVRRIPINIKCKW